MQRRRLGNSGLSVSVVGLGCNNFGRYLDLEASRSVIEAALDRGITLFDTADSYGDSEVILGKVLGPRRDGVVVATKVGSDLKGALGPDWGARGSRRYIRMAVERSLKRLETDWIDLLQLHRPDPETPIGETLSVLTDLVREGKVRYIGSSNFAAWQVVDAEWTAATRGFEHFVSAQNEYSLIRTEPERELIPALERFGIGLLPYFPLANGLLTGKYQRHAQPPAESRIARWGLGHELTPKLFAYLEALEQFSVERGVTPLHVALGALAARPTVSSVIAGATSAGQVRANAQAGQWVPTPEDLADLDHLPR